MSIEQLQSIKITSVEQGKALAATILDEQLAIHRQMQGLTDNDKWQALSDRHYDLRQIRRRLLHEVGLMAMKKKRNGVPRT